MLNLQKKFEKIDPKIIATWLDRDREALHSHLGLNYPHHRAEKDKVESKIQDYTDAADFIDLGEQLFALQRYKGIRDLLGKIENSRMVNFLRKEFSDFNIRELWTAVDLSSAPDNPFELKHAGRVVDFTNDYLSMILGPYRKYRATLIHRYLEAEMIEIQKRSMPDEPPAEISQQEKRRREINQDEKFCGVAFSNFIEGFSVIGLDRVFDVLEKHDLLQPYHTEQRHAAFQKTAKARLDKQARTDGRVKTVVQAFEKGLSVGIATVESETKKVAMEAFFSYLRDLNGTPRDLFAAKYLPAENVKNPVITAIYEQKN